MFLYEGCHKENEDIEACPKLRRVDLYYRGQSSNYKRETRLERGNENYVSKGSSIYRMPDFNYDRYTCLRCMH